MAMAGQSESEVNTTDKKENEAGQQGNAVNTFLMSLQSQSPVYSLTESNWMFVLYILASASAQRTIKDDWG